MLYDIEVQPAQVFKLAQWILTGGAGVQLVVDDSMLLVEQGDTRMAWDFDGSEASQEYLAKAPLDPSPQNALIRTLASMLWPERFPEGHPWHDPDHMYWTSGEHEFEDAFQWSAETIEWVAAEVQKCLPAPEPRER